MNNELLLLIKKLTDKLIEQTKTCAQETLEFKMYQQTQTYSFISPNNLIEEGKWLLGVSSFESTISVFNITNENKSFSVTILGHWPNKSDEIAINELNRLLELRSHNDIDLHVEQVRKKGLILINDYSLSSIDTFREEIQLGMEKARYDDLEDMVYRFQLTHNEIVGILDLKYITRKRICHTLKPNVYQLSDINNTLKYILRENVKINISIDEKIYKSNLKINQTLIFTKRSFFVQYWVLPNRIQDPYVISMGTFN